MVTGVSENGKKPTFFRVLVDGFNTEHMRIPDDFLKHILKERSERAILKLKDCSESSWTVRVMKKRNGYVYFKEGWKEFLKDNSLCDRECLLFIYDGKMHFSIQIFDKNGCDKDVLTQTGSSQNSPLPDTTKRPRGRPRKHPKDPASSSRKQPASSSRKQPASSSRKHHASSSKLPRPLNSRKNDSVEELSSSESCEIIEMQEEEEGYEDDTSEDSEAAVPEYIKRRGKKRASVYCPWQ